MLGDIVDYADQKASQTDEALGSRGRRDIVISFDDVEAEFTNGSRLDRPGGEDTVPGGVNGGTVAATMNLSRTVELIHFGTVYRDRSDRFAHDPLDDTKLLDPGALTGRAIQYRAALMRELILLQSTAEGLRDAIADVYGAPDPSAPDGAFAPTLGGIGGLGQLLGFAGDLLGGPAAASQAMAAADLTTVLDEIEGVFQEINVETIRYEALHAAGIRLHEIRNGLRRYLKTHRDNLVGSLTAPGGGGPGILAGLPFLDDVMPPLLGELFAYAAAAPNLIFDVYMQVLLDLCLVMGPSVDAAARDKSIDAILSGHCPVFSVWYPPPPPAPDDALEGGGPTGIGALDDAYQTAADKVEEAEKKVDEVVGFLSRPYERSPGGPFVDRAFGGTALGLQADEAAGVVAIQALRTAVGYEPPEIVVTIFEKLAALVGGFVRSVYSQLVIIGDRPVDPAELVVAGRKHLVDAVIECIFTSFDAFEVLRDDFMPPVRVQGWTIPINGRALIDRAKELLAEQLDEPLRPVIDFAMGDLAQTLNAARANARGATMEAHLGIIPICFAKMLRNTFFPVWDLLMNSVLAPLGAVVSPVTKTMSGVMDEATGYVQTVRDYIAKAQQVNDILSDGLQIGLDQNDPLAIYKALTDETPPVDDDTEKAAAARRATRKSIGLANRIAQSEYAKVEPEHKWREPDEASGGKP